MTLEKVLEKEKVVVTSIFSFSNNVFYTINDRNRHSVDNYCVVCKGFELDNSIILLFGIELSWYAESW